jgi:hypothetical protein
MLEEKSKKQAPGLYSIQGGILEPPKLKKVKK